MSPSSLLRDSIVERTLQSFHNPRLENGTYLSREHRDELYEQSEIIVCDEYQEPVYTPGVGTFHHIGIVTAQGYGYGGLVGIPESPNSPINVPVIGSTPWYTSLEGYNQGVVERLTKDGNYVFMLGAEGGYPSPIHREETSPITLANSTAALLRFSEMMAAELANEGHIIDPRNRLFVGASRSAAMGLGASVIAADYDQSILAIEAIAPRFPEKLNAVDIPKLVRQVGCEAVKLSFLPLQLGLRHTINHRTTVDLRPQSLLLQPEIGGAIMSGEAGAFTSGMSRDQFLTMVLFSKDGQHEHQSWKDKLWAHSNIDFAHPRGIHMSIPLKQTQTASRQRIEAVVMCKNANLPLTKENIANALSEIQKIRVPLGRRALRVVG